MSDWTKIAGHQRDQRLALQGGPGSRGAAQFRIVVRANNHQGKAKHGRATNSGGRPKERAQAHIQFAFLNQPREVQTNDIEHSNAEVGADAAADPLVTIPQ
jgi:hypothetical protein